MENCWDFLEWLGPDTSTTVLMLLDDPADLVRVSAVSRSWRHFVIENGLSKSLCLRLCPEASNFTHVEVNSVSNTLEVGSSSDVEWPSLEREHRVYALLTHNLISSEAQTNCIYRAIYASSTDNFPDESIDNTLEPSELVDQRPSYWSSGGQKDPGVPERLTYRLNANLCLVNEIKIRPFKAFFQYGHPIYSAKSVRFRTGHCKSRERLEAILIDGYTEDSAAAGDDDFTWTYVSPEFPMVQQDVLQSFKLPHPVISIGGMLQIELMGRVQKQAMDGLYYICVCHVQVIGCRLSPSLDVDISETLGSPVLKYFPDATSCSLPAARTEDESGVTSPWQTFRARLRHLSANGGWNQAILNTLLGPIHFSDDEGEDEDVSDIEPIAE